MWQFPGRFSPSRAAPASPRKKCLDRDSVVANIATTAADGKTYQTDFYSLGATLAVRYRVNSPQATRFIVRGRFAEFQRIQDAEWQNDFEKMARGLEER